MLSYQMLHKQISTFLYLKVGLPLSLVKMPQFKNTCLFLSSCLRYSCWIDSCWDFQWRIDLGSFPKWFLWRDCLVLASLFLKYKCITEPRQQRGIQPNIPMGYILYRSHCSYSLYQECNISGLSHCGHNHWLFNKIRRGTASPFLPFINIWSMAIKICSEIDTRGILSPILEVVQSGTAKS